MRESWCVARDWFIPGICVDIDAKRLLGVLNQRLSSRAWIMGDAYTIADMATFPWVRNLIGFYEAGDLVGIQDFPHVKRALAAFVARPAVVKGLGIPQWS